MYVYDKKKFWNAIWKEYNVPFGHNLRNVLEQYDKNNMIGRLVLDLGCSSEPVTNFLDLKRHERILLDISDYVFELDTAPDKPITLQCDLTQFNNSSLDYTFYKYSLKNKKLDAIIAADNIINYVPWKNVFRKLNSDLKDNGLVFLCFGIGIGRTYAYYPEYPSSFDEVKDFFEKELKHSIIETEIKKNYLEYLILVTKKE